MGFRRREAKENPWIAALQNVAGIAANYFQTQDAEQVELGEQVKEQAAAEYAAGLQQLADPNSGLTEQQRQQLSGMVTGLGNVAKADPRQAAEIYSGLQANVTRTRQVEKPTLVPGNHPITNPVQAGPTRKVNETYQDQMNPTEALSFLMNKSATGNQKREEEIYQRDVRTEREGDARRHRQAMAVQDDAQEFSTAQTRASRNATREDIIFEQKATTFAGLQEIMRDPAMPPAVKAQAEADLEQMKQENPDLEEFVIGGSVTDPGAVAERRAGQEAAMLNVDLLRQGLESGDLGIVQQQQDIALTRYSFGQQRLTDSFDLAARADVAAGAGGVQELQAIKNILKHPDLYPEQAERLRDAGYSLGKINENINIAKSVRATEAGERKFRTQEMKHTLTAMVNANEMDTINIADGYAKSFDSVEDFNKFLDAVPGRRAKFGKDKINLMTAAVRKNQKVYQNNQGAVAAEAMLNGGPPADTEVWEASFVGEAIRGGMSKPAAEALAAQALEGWAREGEEFDATMVRTHLETEYLAEQVETERINQAFIPTEQRMRIGEHNMSMEQGEAAVAASESATTTNNINNQTLAVRNRAELAGTRATNRLTAAEANYRAVQARSFESAEAREEALNQANIELREAQAGAATALETLRTTQANGTQGGVEAEDINAQRQVITARVDALVNEGTGDGCFVRPAGGDDLYAAANAWVAGPNADTEACMPYKAEMAELDRDLAILQRAGTVSMLSGYPIQISPEAFNLRERIAMVTEEAQNATVGRKAELGEEYKRLWSEFARMLGNPGAAKVQQAYSQFD